ncbi:MAG: dCMP deaminase family protein [Desulfurellales bacterium]|nr:MAG: dCMP deaminase family protein [Desulfurellales bacterium]
MTRPSWDSYFCQLAKLAATRATCQRRQVGCVLVQNRRVIATGYNGSLPGDAHCTDAGCFMIDGHCVRTNHAEINALTDAARRGVTVAGATAYVTLQPCWHCLRALIAAGVVCVYYTEKYPVDNELYARHHNGRVTSIVKYLDPQVAL